MPILHPGSRRYEGSGLSDGGNDVRRGFRLAVRTGAPVVTVAGWDLPAPGAMVTADAGEAVRLVREAVVGTA
ncbi:hypothetical protein BH11ACT1_BH11ACT1_22180 [soil metagenome]